VRREYDPAEMRGREFYRLLTAVVLPRPIAWVSSVSADGVDNVAPHSFFNVAAANPPIIQFSSIGEKDSFRNIEATGEFVVNFAGRSMLKEINASSAPYPPGVSEFDAVGIQRAASSRVRPSRVARAVVALECRLHSILPLGDSRVVFGSVVCASVDDSVLVDGHPDAELLQPLARLGRNEWSTLGEVIRLDRPKSAG
jgi:flavin reductase (DIM6/NTAB) family NADH-FMN oxidoreductase RutF